MDGFIGVAAVFDVDGDSTTVSLIDDVRVAIEAF